MENTKELSAQEVKELLEKINGQAEFNNDTKVWNEHSLAVYSAKAEGMKGPTL